jgi:hypothetical protein
VLAVTWAHGKRGTSYPLTLAQGSSCHPEAVLAPRGPQATTRRPTELARARQLGSGALGDGGTAPACLLGVVCSVAPPAEVAAGLVAGGSSLGGGGASMGVGRQ